MRLTLSEVYACRPDDEMLRLIEEFGKMVKWWAEKGADFEGGPYEELRRRHYYEWGETWPEWNRQLIHTSVHVAYERLKLSKRPEERPRVVDLNVDFAVIHPKMVVLKGEKLRISTVKGGYAYAHLIPKSLHQKKLLEQAEAGVWNVGQVLLTEKWVLLPFTAERFDDWRIEALSQLVDV